MDQTQPEATPEIAPRKCGFPHCRSKSADAELFSCIVSSCEKQVHRRCFEQMLRQADATIEEAEIIFCSKRCYNKHKKVLQQQSAETSGAGRRVLWSRDGSLAVLMNWITAEGIYEKYTGGSGNGGRTKDSYHGDIRRLIARTAGCTDRLEKDIASKIATLEKSFRDATDWLNCTGAGLDNPGDVQEYVKKKWPQYYDLEPVMRARPNSTPLFTSDGPEQHEDEDQDLISDDDDVVMHQDEDMEIQLRDSTQNTPSLTPDRTGSVGRSLTPVLSHSQQVQANAVVERTDSPRRRVSIASPRQGADERRTRRRIGSSRRDSFQAEESFGGASASALLSLRKDEVEMRREEINSKREVDVAQTRKLNAEAKYVEAKADRERQSSHCEHQSSRLSLLKQKKELRDLGVSEEEIQDAFNES